MLPRDSANSISTGTLTTPNVDWPKTFEQWEASNMSQAAFCKENQIDYKQFIYQRIKQHRRKSNSRILPINILPTSTNMSPVGNHFMLYCPNGVKVSIPTNTNAESLKTLITCLGIR